MKRAIALVFGGIAVAVVVVVALSDLRRSAPPPASVAGGGTTLVSASIALPEDPAGFGAVPGAALLDANCSGCHSASMVLSQPPLKPEQWQAEVTKMREVYKAPVAERDVPAILDGLARISAKRQGP